VSNCLAEYPRKLLLEGRVNSEEGLANVRVASPCSASWDSMEGDDKIRFCESCKLSVYNLSAMTAEEGAQLLSQRQSSDRLCVRFYKRSDGTVITADCPVGLRAIRLAFFRRWQRIAAAVLWLVGMLTQAQAQDQAQLPQRLKRNFEIQVPKCGPVPNKGGSVRGIQAVQGAVQTDLNFGPFMAELHNRIYSNWPAAVPLDPDRQPVVTFKIHRYGKFSDLKLHKSCGIPAVDNIALETVRKTGPFPDFPPGSPDEVDIQFTFKSKNGEAPKGDSPSVNEHNSAD
jgi:TonB family protein